MQQVTQKPYLLADLPNLFPSFIDTSPKFYQQTHLFASSLNSKIPFVLKGDNFPEKAKISFKFVESHDKWSVLAEGKCISTSKLECILPWKQLPVEGTVVQVWMQFNSNPLIDTGASITFESDSSIEPSSEIRKSFALKKFTPGKGTSTTHTLTLQMDNESWINFILPNSIYQKCMENKGPFKIDPKDSRFIQTGVENLSGVKYWIFNPTFGRHAKCRLDYSSSMDNQPFTQIIVVRDGEQLKKYKYAIYSSHCDC